MANRKDNRWASLPTADAFQRQARTLFEAVFLRLDALDTNGTGSVPADGSVTTAKLDTGAVTTIKLGSLAVTLAKVGTDVKAYLPGAPGFTVGAEAGNVINVVVQLKDYNGSNLASACVCQVWLSNTAGAAVTGTAPSGTVAVGTNGVILASHTAKTHLVVATNASGAFDLNITEAGSATWYLNVEHDGRLYSSGAITFA